MSRLKVSDILHLYKNGEKISCLSLYDACFSHLADLAHIPLILVGDSLGTTILGYRDTIEVKLDDCLRCASAVVRGSERAMIVGDLPFMTYHGSIDQGLEVARRFIQDAKVSALKLEGGQYYIPIIKAIINAGIPVMGHLGILPQRVRATEGYKIQGKTYEEEEKLLDEALALEKAGVFALVLEGIKKNLAKKITETLKIPTIGIGSGIYCSGQIQVAYDILNLGKQKTPKHSQHFADLNSIVLTAFKQYKNKVKNLDFPTDKESF